MDKAISKSARKQAVINKLSAKMPEKVRNKARQTALAKFLKG